MEDVYTPPRSMEYIFTSSLILGLGAVDLTLTLQFAAVLGMSSTLTMIVLIIALFSFSLITLMAHFRVKYVITDDKLVIRQLFGEKEILLKDIIEARKHKLGYFQNLLLEIHPTYTVKDEIMIRMNNGTHVFVSPRGREDFIRKIGKFRRVRLGC